MKFNNLTIENFLVIGKATVSLRDRGLVIIQGENNESSAADSNGAGKSSIADAVVWCLFGVTSRGVKGDAVVNREVKSNTHVSLDIEDDDGRIYTVSRYRKSQEHKNSIHVKVTDGQDTVDLTKGTPKLTQEIIEKIVGCTYEVFCSSVYAAQDKIPSLPEMTDKNLKMLIEEASGMSLLENCYEEAKQRASEAKSKVKSSTYKLESAEDALRFQEEQIDVIKNNSKDWDEDQKQKVEAEKKNLKTLEDQHKNDLSKYNAAKTAAQKCEDIIKIVEDKVSGISDYQHRYEQAKLEVDNIKLRASEIKTEINRKKEKIERLKAKIESSEMLIGTPCESCGTPIQESSISDVISTCKNKIEELLGEIKKDIVGFEVLREQNINLTSKAKKLKSEIPDVSSLIEKQNSARATLQKTKNIIHDFEYKKAEIKNIKEDIDALEKQENPFKGTVEKFVNNIEKKKKEVVEAKKNLNEAVEAEELAKQALAVYAPSGVRARILDHVTPFLNERTAKYLVDLTDGEISATWTTLVKNANGELREKFSIEVGSMISGATFQALSGGEKRKVRLATALALQDLVSQRATKPIDLFIGDEIDDALDMSGQERLIALLKKKASEKGSVFVISHNELKWYANKKLTVVKEGGKSYILDQN